MIRRIHILLLLACVVTGCDPYRFRMGEGNAIEGRIRSPLSTVEKGKYSIIIRDTGIVSLIKYGTTEFVTNFYLRLRSGEGVRVSPRAAVGTSIEDRGIRMTFDRNGLTVDTGGVQLFNRKGVGFASDSLVNLQLYSDAHFLQAIANCDTVLKMKFSKMESDEILIQALANSEVQLMAPNWKFVPWF